MPRREKDPRRLTIYEDDVARVDVTLDPDGDLEIATWFREGNRWTVIESAPTVVPPAGLLRAMMQLGLISLPPGFVTGWRRWFMDFRNRALVLGLSEIDVKHVEKLGSVLEALLPGARELEEAALHGVAPGMPGAP